MAFSHYQLQGQEEAIASIDYRAGGYSPLQLAWGAGCRAAEGSFAAVSSSVKTRYLEYIRLMEQWLAEFLVSEQAVEFLIEARRSIERNDSAITSLTQLRRSLDPDRATAVWELATLRTHARHKLGATGARLFFDRPALEMASGSACSSMHARRLYDLGVRSVVDLCGGVGLDTIAFARAGMNVTMYELDPARAVFARANLAASHTDWSAGVPPSSSVSIANGDATALALPSADAAYFDPMRRSGKRRWVGIGEDTQPGLQFAVRLKDGGYGTVLCKLSPALSHAVEQGTGGVLEFVSVGGECKEALLWLGKSPWTQRSATVLGPDQSLTGSPGRSAVVRSGAGEYLYEPDPAVIRAGLVGELAFRIDSWQIDPHIAYLYSDSYVPTPFARAYKVLDALPYDIPRIRRRLVDLGFGSVVVKKRGFDIEPEQVRKLLKLAGGPEAHLVITRVGDRHLAMIVEQVRQSGVG